MAIYANDQVNQTTDALAIERERLAVTLRLIDNSVAITDKEGKIVLINEAAEVLTDRPAGEAVGKHFCEVFHLVDEKSREHRSDMMEGILKTGGMIDFDDRMILIARDGTEHLVTYNGLPTYNRDSNIIGAVLVFRDITETRKMEVGLLEVEKSESIGILAGGIAHDFNNILAGVIGNISLMKMDMEPEDRNFERLAKAERAALDAKNLTQQLLTFSRGGTPVLETASIAGLLKESASFVLSGSNVRCEFFIPDNLWPVEVDEGQISQVINNLIINADQAMPEGGIIEVHAENTIPQTRGALPLDGRRCVKISIKDHGTGIPEDSLQKVFAPYFTTKQDGSGLGLAVSQSIIRNHDGHIAVESGVGVGTTFSIYLPASSEDFTIEGKLEEQVFVGTEKILIMDDDEVVRELAHEMLSNIGYRVTVARDGSEAIELYRKAEDLEHPFDAVIMDLTVPGGMGGREAIQKLLRIDPEAKVIVSSGYSNDPIMMDFRKYGFSGVIAKPYRVRDLGKVLYETISQDGGTD
ncbi:ATP-binding protein [Candidatus Poribacteria bacterium]